MQFAILLFINLILWALFYLVISLKLEKSASEFREKKLRREMDEIIREFNETAERNISLLENRITILKRLMARTGTVRTVDFNVGSGDSLNGSTDGAGTDTEGPLRESGKSEGGLHAERRPPGAGSFTRGYEREAAPAQQPWNGAEALSVLMKRVIGRVRELRDSFIGGDAPGNEMEKTVAGEHSPGENYPIEKDALDMPACGFHGKVKEFFDEDEARLSRMFMDTRDKYGLINELYDKGCSMELMSRCSGMPVGEIRLVLNLNRSIDHETP